MVVKELLENPFAFELDLDIPTDVRGLLCPSSTVPLAPLTDRGASLRPRGRLA